MKEKIQSVAAQVRRRRFGRPLGAALLSTALVTVALAPVPAEANQFKRIRDVNVSCNNALQCDLFITNPSVTLYTVGFRRLAAFQAPISLYLTMREPLSAGSELLFIIDGEPVVALPASDFSYRAAIAEYSIRDEEVVLPLLAAAAAGDRLQVIYRTRTGQSSAQFSLSGIVAGSIFMDEVQGRTGREDALEAMGEVLAAAEAEAEMAESEPGDMVDLDVLPAGLRRYYEGPDAPCADLDGALPDPLGGFEFNLGDDQQMVGLRCSGAGAYNFPFAFWLGSADGRFERLALPTMSDQAPAAQLLAWNADWNPETRELSALFKGRGLGDCGEMHRWRLSETGSSFGFVLEEMRVKSECDGAFDGTMQSWDQIWPVPADRS